MRTQTAVWILVMAMALVLALESAEGAGPTYRACLAACNRGTSAIESFCRRIRLLPGQVRAACWAVTLGSPTACKGFCYAYEEWFD